MKTILFLTFIAVSYGGKLDRTYLPPSTAGSAGGHGLDTPKLIPGLVNAYNGNTGSYQQPINNYDYNRLAASFRPERPQAAFERNADILSYDNVNNVDNYVYRYETSNGIFAEETGIATNGVVAQGGYSYIGDDGRQYSIRYTADENGFRPVGAHIPTPPPIPAAILRSLEQNARDEAAGIFDDGSYKESHYGDNRGYNHGYNYPAPNAASIAQANLQAQAINQAKIEAEAKQAASIQAQANHQASLELQAINHQANIQTQAINQANAHAQANLQANLQAQAINEAKSRAHANLQANLQAQAIHQAQAQAQAINEANSQADLRANLQAQAINQANAQAQAISHQAKIQAQAINHLEQANIKAINNLEQAKSSGSRAYLPPKNY